MTMPEFDPVAWRYELKASEYTFAEKRYLNETYAPRPTALHTAGQLTEAYEAGKREASEDIEQAALEKWLYDKCPSGDVESVQRQWLESYEYAELAGKMEQAAQINHLQMALADTEALEAETSARCLKQAEQIEMMRSTLHGIVDADWRKWEELASPEEFVRWAKSRANHVLSTTTEQALEQFAAKVREQCAQMLLNGSFLHDQSPARLLAIEAAKAIRAIKELP